jgi:hypothetical protein
MNKSYLFFTILCLCYFSPFGQNILSKPGTPTTTSFYSLIQHQKDYPLNRPARKDIKNSANKIIEHIENPKGTVVLDADGNLDDLKAMITTPEKLMLKEDFVNFPFTTADGTTYRIPVVNKSSHFKLNQELVIDDLKLFITECEIKKNEVPLQISIEHSTIFDCCEFLGYKSISGLFEGPYYQRRLNLSCVFINKPSSFLTKR